MYTFVSGVATSVMAASTGIVGTLVTNGLSGGTHIEALAQNSPTTPGKEQGAGSPTV